MNNMPILKPCPFCGGESVRTDYDKDRVTKGIYGHFIECPRCQAGSCYCATEAEAVTAWNRRGTRIIRCGECTNFNTTRGTPCCDYWTDDEYKPAVATDDYCSYGRPKEVSTS